MRRPEDICLLCKERHSIKTESHIIPRFISKAIFGVGQGQGYLLDSQNAHKPPEKKQDSAKEDYILCPECERYFEIMETYIAARIQNRLWDVRTAADFEDTQNEEGIRRKLCLIVDQRIFRLFIYSIVWRCSISTTKAHNDFNLSAEEAELLRENLSLNFSTTQAELLLNVENNSEKISIVNFVFFTSESFKDRTANVVFTSPIAVNPYYLILNDFVLLISFKEWKETKIWNFLLNNDTGKIKIGFFKESFWNELKNDFINMYVKEAHKQAESKGTQLFIAKDKI